MGKTDREDEGSAEARQAIVDDLLESIRTAASNDSTLADCLTEIERVLVAVTPIMLILEAVLRESESGTLSQAGCYRRDPAQSVMTTDGSGMFELIGIKVPIQTVLEIVDAHRAARATPYGDRLAAKILAFQKPADTKPD